MAHKSKNHILAREELRKKQEALSKGKVPSEYKEIIQQKKTFSSKEAFIKNRDLEEEYKGRSYATQQY
jgi:hypothetical protein